MTEVVVYQPNGTRLEPAFRLPSRWTENWRDALPFEMKLPDYKTDSPTQTATLELLWRNGAPHIVVTRGAENLEGHPMVVLLQKEEQE